MSNHKPTRARRNYTKAFKLQVLAETREPGVSVASVARRHDMNANVVFGWMRDPRFGGKAAPVEFPPVAACAAPGVSAALPERRDLLELIVDLPGGVRVHCRDEPSLIVVLRAARRAT